MYTKKFSFYYLALCVFCVIYLLGFTGCVKAEKKKTRISEYQMEQCTQPIPSATPFQASPNNIDVSYYRFVSPRDVVLVSEEEYNTLVLNENLELVRVTVTYYSGNYYNVKAEWLCQPNCSKVCSIALDNVNVNAYNGYIFCDTRCEGSSQIPDFNHSFSVAKYYYFGDNKILNSIINTDTKDDEMTFYIDLCKGVFCPYYMDPAISSGCFDKHMVWWKEITFCCSGFLLDAEQPIHITLKP